MALSSTLAAASPNTKSVNYQLDKAREIYSTVKSVNQALRFFKVGANVKDVSYLDRLMTETKGMKLPAMTIKGQLIRFDGLEKPLAVVDLRRGVFSYDGRRVVLNFKSGIEAKVNELERTFSGESAGIMDLMFPKARAMARSGILGIISGAMLGGGLAASLASIFNGGEGLEMGVGLAGLGVVGLLAAEEMKKDETPQVRCVPGPNGTRQVIKYTRSSNELEVLPDTPGSGVIGSLCGGPGGPAGFNSALSAPPVLPAMTTPLTTLPASTAPAPADSEKPSEE